MSKLYVTALIVFIVGVVAGAMLFGKDTVKEQVVERIVGSSVGPDRFNPCESTDGVLSCFKKVALNQATTTICAIKSPSATSTLALNSGVSIRTSSTTASRVTLAKATTAFATTTLLGVADISANAQDTVLASTTVTNLETSVFAPNTWFVVGMAGGIGTFSPVGNCQATFNVI